LLEKGFEFAAVGDAAVAGEHRLKRPPFHSHEGEITMTFPDSRNVSKESIGRSAFEDLYAGMAPWDLPRPQGVLTAVADRVASPVLDAGCGTGENALFFAKAGHRVTGIDFVAEAIQRAQAKAAERGIAVEFLVKDALALANWDSRFATVIDSGLFHVFSDTDRPRYVRGLAHVVGPGGRLILLCFSDQEPGTEGPRRVSRQELYDAFSDGWEVESVEPTQMEVNPEFTEVRFSEGGPKGWLAIVRRTA
jgi:SAM-dependent methyltransferase